MKKFLLLFVTFQICFLGFSQEGWDWGADKPEAQGKWFLLNQLVKAKEYQRARPEVNWLLTNAPNLKVDLYIQSSKVYEMLERKAKGAEKVVFQDTVLMIYDTRLEKFGDSSNVYNRKGLIYYRYTYKKPNQKNVLYAFYTDAYRLNKDKTYSANLLSLMKLARYKKAEKSMIDDEVLTLYQKIMATLNLQKADALLKGNTRSHDAIVRNEEKVVQELLKAINITCDFVKTNFGSNLQNNPEDLDAAKMIYNLMLEQKCFDEPLFQQSMALILEKEPSYGGYKNQGHIFKNQKKYSKAIVSYNKAIELASSNEQKGELYLSIAKLYLSKENKSKAKEYANKCISIKYKASDAYTIIGNLYMYSYDECKSGDPVKDRLIYIAAYNMYSKANNQKRMKEAKENFPSGGDIHMHNMAIGDNVKIDCWINETVQVQKRD
jgi:tetratricopeptide (TPR) repeat protein